MTDWYFEAMKASHYANVARLHRLRRERDADIEQQRGAKARTAANGTSPMDRLEADIERQRRRYRNRQFFRPAPAATLRLVGEVTREKAAALIARLEAAATAEKVTLLIDSHGGSATAGYALFVAIAAHPAGVTTIARGLCASAAVTVFAAGKRRRAHSRARFCLHYAAAEARPGERLTKDRLAAFLKATHRCDEDDLACLQRATGRAADAIAAAMTDRIEGPEAMQSIGLVHEVEASPDGDAGIERAWTHAAILEPLAERSGRRRIL